MVVFDSGRVDMINDGTYISYGVQSADAMIILICTRSVGVTYARYDICCIAVAYTTGTVHNRMTVVNSSGAMESLVYDLVRNIYGVRLGFVGRQLFVHGHSAHYDCIHYWKRLVQTLY